MKAFRFLFSISLVSLMGFFEPTLAQNDIKEQLTIPLSDPTKPSSLHVNLISGSIHVSAYAGKEVIIEATVKNNSEKREESSNGMKRLSTKGGLEITAEERNNTVKVSSRLMQRPLVLNIKVPTQCSLKVSTVNDGEISVEGVSGDFEITNVNGGIQLTNVSGSAVVNTINGNLKANFKAVTDAPMAFSTLNGNVDVTFPPSAKFDVKLRSDRGEIYSDFDVDVDKTQPQSTKTSKDGMYKVSVSDWVQGKVNGGGKEVMMKNMHGNIYIRKGK
ncbi:MAG: DUF4097 family beta strand repeat-containing protein [Spirosomataceae bacterium]